MEAAGIADRTHLVSSFGSTGTRVSWAAIEGEYPRRGSIVITAGTLGPVPPVRPRAGETFG
jgi:hypothetical protein